MRHWLNGTLSKAPLTGAVTLVFFIIVVLQNVPGKLGYLNGAAGGATIRFVLGGAALSFLIWLGWGNRSGVTTHPRHWHKCWPLLSLPLVAVGILGLLTVDVSALTITQDRLFKLVFENMAIGFYEEMVMRGLVLHILFRAWGQTRIGLIKAVVVQAIIFGVMHYISLLAGGGFSAVTVQVAYATLMGIGFGGLALLTRSIWPGVCIHGFIDAALATRTTLSAEVLDTAAASSGEMTLVAALFPIIISLMFAAVPGFLYASRAELND